MGAAIGQSLPVAIGVMISPLPIVAVVLMLTSAKALVNASAFLVGWFVAVGGIALVVALVAPGASAEAGDAPDSTGWFKIALGVLLLVVAARQWQGRPRAGVEPPTPKWMAAIDTFTPVKAAGLAVLLGGINPKNLLLVVSGGLAIAAAAPSGDAAAHVVPALVFGIVASIGVAAPVVVYATTGERAARLLDELKTWMIHHNAVIMAVLLLVIGVKMIGDGITVG